MSRVSRRVVALLCWAMGAGASNAQAQDVAGDVETTTTVESEAAPKPERAASNKPAPNSVFFEGLGAGLYYSINYERRVIDDLGVRAGFGYVSLTTSAGNTESSASYLTIPITASYLGLRGRRSGLELGGGLTLAYAGGSVSAGVNSVSGSGMAPFGTALVGYRLHPVDGAGFQFRVGLMALMAKGLSFDPDPNKFGVLPWFYMSFGAAF